MICSPVMHMLVSLSYLLHVHWTCILVCIFVWPVLSEYGSKICFFNDKKHVFILKFHWSDVWIIIDYVNYNPSSKIKHHFDQFSIIINDRWNTNTNHKLSINKYLKYIANLSFSCKWTILRFQGYLWYFNPANITRTPTVMTWYPSILLYQNQQWSFSAQGRTTSLPNLSKPVHCLVIYSICFSVKD